MVVRHDKEVPRGLIEDTFAPVVGFAATTLWCMYPCQGFCETENRTEESMMIQGRNHHVLKFFVSCNHYKFFDYGVLDLHYTYIYIYVYMFGVCVPVISRIYRGAEQIL